MPYLMILLVLFLYNTAYLYTSNEGANLNLVGNWTSYGKIN